MQRFITASDNHEVILLATVQEGRIRWETFVEVPRGLQQAISVQMLETIGGLYGCQARGLVLLRWKQSWRWWWLRPNTQLSIVVGQ